MKDFSAVPGFKAEIAKPRGSKPAWIFTLTVAGVEYCLSDMVVTIPSWHGGVTTRAWVAQWGEISEQVSGSLNEIRISDFSLTLIADPDAGDNINYLIAHNDLEASQCSLYLWFQGLNAATDPPQEFYRGYVRDLATGDNGLTWQLILEDEASRLSANFGEILNQVNYPTAMSTHIGRMLPVVFGTAVKVMPPIAKIDSTYNYYLFGCPLDSVSATAIKNSDGSQSAVTATFIGANPAFGGNATLAVTKQTGVAVTGLQTVTVEPFQLAVQAGTFGVGTNQAIDGSDSTSYFFYIPPTGYAPCFSFTVLLTLQTRVRMRVELSSVASTGASVTVALRNGLNILVGSAVLTTPFGNGTIGGAWFDTGWITVTPDSIGTWTATVLSNTLPMNINIWAAHLDIEHTVNTGAYTYTTNPTDLICTATRLISGGKMPDAVATKLMPVVTASASGGVLTIRPIAAGVATGVTIINEGNHRDGLTNTFSTWVATSTGYATCTFDPASMASYSGIASRFRMGARISANIPTGERCNLCGTNNFTGNQTNALIYSSWSTTMRTLILYFTPGVTGIFVFEIWLEVDTTTPVTITPLFTVTGTWSSLPTTYQVNGAIIESKRIIDHLDYLAYQFRCWFRLSCGVAKMIWISDDPTPVAALSAVVVDSGRPRWTRKRAPITEVVNSITLRYGRDYSSTGDSAYAKIVSSFDASSIAAFGQLSRDELFKCDFITQDQQADSVGSFYLSALKTRYWLEELTVFLDQIALEFGDVVTLPDGRVGTVVSTGIQPGSMEQMDRIKLTVMV